MPSSLGRRAALVALTAAGAAAAAPLILGGVSPGGLVARAGGGSLRPDGRVGAIAIADDDLALGSAQAPVTMVKYASLTCPHCAAFHLQTGPGLKQRYIEPGMVHFVHRDFPLDQLALAAAVLVRCGGSARAFAFLNLLYGRQGHWARAADPMAALEQIAGLGGVGAGEFAACRDDQALLDRILRQRKEAADVYGVRATPTLLINGARYSGNLSLAQLDAILEPLA
jgi:protein-disulfide isomerase